MFDKVLNIDIKDSPLPPWPGRYFIFAEVAEITHDWDPDVYNYYFEDKTDNFRDSVKVLHRNVKMKLFQPNMKLFEVETLQKSLEPLGFMDVPIRYCEMAFCDTFSEHEVEEIFRCLNLSDHLSGYVSQAYLPTPNDPFGYFFEYPDYSIATKCFTDEPGFRSLGYSVCGACDLVNPSKMLEPPKDRLLKKEIIDLIERSHDDFLQDVVGFTREFSQQYMQAEEEEMQKSIQEESDRIKKEMEIQKAMESIKDDDDYYYDEVDDIFAHMNSDEIEDLRENHDPASYDYYYNDDYDFEDLGED